MTTFRVKGVLVSFAEDGTMLMNHKPATIEHIGNSMYKASTRICRYVKPKAVVGARKRKQALKASIKTYVVSLIYSKG